MEIGPASTLATMAKRTLADPLYADWDTAMSVNRKVLSCKSNQEEIYHIRANDAALGTSTTTQTKTTPPPSAKPSPPTDKVDSMGTSAVQIMGQQENVLAAEILPDEPITAKQILVFLVAHKLKKLPSDLPGSSTIKALVQGLLPSIVII